MPTGTGTGTRGWPKTVFDTPEWLRAWERATAEKAAVLDDGSPPVYSLADSPFWRGYEFDVGVEPVWDRDVLTIGSVYAVFGPAYLASDPEAVAERTDRGIELARQHGACGLFVLNLPADAAEAWAEVRPPDVQARLDLAYHQIPGAGPDPVMGALDKHDRTEWRRRWRRTTEKGVRLVEESDPAPERIAEVIALANGSALKHGWPQLYDQGTVEAVLAVPGARLIRADWDGRTVAGFVALEHDRQLHLWAGGMDHTVVREVSPYLFLLYELLSAGVERGWQRIEFGRGNDQFKRKHGFTAVPLWSHFYAARAEEAPAYRERLTALHDGLARFQAQ